jgi:hypothetical protein
MLACLETDGSSVCLSENHCDFTRTSFSDIKKVERRAFVGLFKTLDVLTILFNNSDGQYYILGKMLSTLYFSDSV